jgi:hypothetical protein
LNGISATEYRVVREWEVGIALPFFGNGRLNHAAVFSEDWWSRREARRGPLRARLHLAFVFIRRVLAVIVVGFLVRQIKSARILG